MGLGMKHELDPDQYRALLKEIRKLTNELQSARDMAFIIAAANSGLCNSMDDIVKQAQTLKKLYLNSKWGEAAEAFNEKKGE